MSRGKSRKLLTTLPDDYSGQELDGVLDKRTKIARAILDRIQLIETDLGGADALTHTKRSLVRRAVFLEALVESQELRIAHRHEVDVGAYTQALNSMLGVYRLLGLERKAKPIRRLRDHLETA